MRSTNERSVTKPNLIERHPDLAQGERSAVPTDTPSAEALLKVMRAIEANPTISQRELAHAVGISLGKANYCVRALVEKGLVKAKNFRNSRNKLRYMYCFTPAGATERARLAAVFLKEKIVEYEDLKKEIQLLKLESGE